MHEIYTEETAQQVKYQYILKYFPMCALQQGGCGLRMHQHHCMPSRYQKAEWGLKELSSSEHLPH